MNMKMIITISLCLFVGVAAAQVAEPIIGWSFFPEEVKTAKKTPPSVRRVDSYFT